jgi:hypothetical protein
MIDRHAAARAARWVALFSCAGLGLALGMWLATPWFQGSQASARTALPPRLVAPEPRAQAERSRKPQEELVPLAGEPMSDGELARATIEDLRMRTAALLAEMAVPDEYIAVHSQQPVLAQMLADILEHSPEVEDELAAEVDRVLCDPMASLADVLVLAKVGLALREASSERGIHCVIEQHRAGGAFREDPALWAVLELWQASGRPASPQLIELASLARDPRTVQRLRRDERGVGSMQQAIGTTDH